MESMQERIDALVKMRKEKPEHKWEWDRLRNALVTEDGLLTVDEIAHLNTAFKDIQRLESLKVWDDRFHEVLITGKMANEYDASTLAWSHPQSPASWSSTAVAASAQSMASTAASHVLTKEMIQAYKEYKRWLHCYHR